MCGRFVSSTPAVDLASHFGATEVTGDLPPRWNVAPTSEIWVVHDVTADPQRDEAPPVRVLEPMHWGLQPSWAKDPAMANRMFNARVETAASKPSFRSAFRRRRCLIPVDGFYEWAGVQGQHAKQPWYFSAVGEEPLALAGLWEQRRPEDGGVRSCTILTTAADAAVGAVHDRMPVALAATIWDLWLDPALDDPDAIDGLLQSNVSPALNVWAVSTAVGNPRNEGPELAEPLG